MVISKRMGKTTDMVEAENLQSNINLLRWVDVVLLGPVAHEPRLHSHEGEAKEQAADKKHPEQDWMRSSQTVNKKLDFIFVVGYTSELHCPKCGKVEGALTCIPADVSLSDLLG